MSGSRGSRISNGQYIGVSVISPYKSFSWIASDNIQGHLEMLQFYPEKQPETVALVMDELERILGSRTETSYELIV